jgi:hypothetical protein
MCLCSANPTQFTCMMEVAYTLYPLCSWRVAFSPADSLRAAAQPAGQGAAVKVVHNGQPEGARKDHPGADAGGACASAEALQLPGLAGHQSGCFWFTDLLAVTLYYKAYEQLCSVVPLLHLRTRRSLGMQLLDIRLKCLFAGCVQAVCEPLLRGRH